MKKMLLAAAAVASLGAFAAVPFKLGDPRRDAVGNYRGWIRPEAGDPKNSLDHVHYTTNDVAPVALVVDRAQDALEVSDHSPVIFTFRLSK